MQLPGFIGFISVLILACDSDDKDWRINVNSNINAVSGSNVIIQCNFSYPQKYNTSQRNIEVFWKNLDIKDNSNCSKNDKDLNAFVFHTNQACVLDKYKHKTSLIGDKDKGNCSLQITNIESSDQKLYVRVFVSNEKYSYKMVTVTISVNGTGFKSGTSKTVTAYNTTPAVSDLETTITNEMNPISTESETILHVVIPVAVAVVIISLAIGIFFFRKCRRSHIVNREDSGYYANFSRALANPPKRETSSNTQDKKLPPRKAIDDPVYINVQALPGHMDQNTDCVDNIYANMDYRN